MITILFFIESLRAGGKERRLIELLKKLSERDEYAIKLVLIKNEIHYKEIFDLKIPIHIIERKFVKKDPRLFYLFFKICRNISPDIIHVWGNMPALYALPSSVFLHIPIINNQITDTWAFKKRFTFYYLTHLVNFKFASILISNSQAGLKIIGLIPINLKSFTMVFLLIDLIL